MTSISEKKYLERLVIKYSQKNKLSRTKYSLVADPFTSKDMISGIETLLKEDGVFIFENHYLLDVIQGGQFDTIYHEHVCYFSIKPLQKLFANYGMEIFNIEKTDIDGGSYFPPSDKWLYQFPIYSNQVQGETIFFKFYDEINNVVIDLNETYEFISDGIIGDAFNPFILTGSTTNCEDEDCIDIDGNVYQTVQIGDQIWMAENLKTTHYQNGDDIPHVIDTSDWDALSTGAYCEYENNPINSDIYGRLYNWYTIDDSRGVCPEGFHVPSDDEIKQLEMFLGMSQQEANDVSFRGTDQGSQLAGRADLWNDGDLENNPVFDSTGFVAIPGGARIGGNTNFIDMGIWGDYWSSTTQDWGAWVRNFAYYNSASHRQICDKHYGMAIRCVSDNYILGDINGDEILNILDIVLMINMILSNEYSIVADVNEDGSVDVLDVVLMVNILVGGLPQSN